MKDIKEEELKNALRKVRSFSGRMSDLQERDNADVLISEYIAGEMKLKK